MTFPEDSEIEAASAAQLLFWYRFLPAPGAKFIDSQDESGLELERRKWNRIRERLEEEP